MWLLRATRGSQHARENTTNTNSNPRRRLQKPAAARDKTEDMVEDRVVVSLPLSLPLPTEMSLPLPLSLHNRNDVVMTAEAATRAAQPLPQPRDTATTLATVITTTTTTTAIAGGAHEGEGKGKVEDGDAPPSRSQRQSQPPVQSQPLLADLPSCCYSASASSLSIYPLEEMALDILKRTRAKTPCFWVGQLDQPKPCDDSRFDSAIALACEYQSVLPPRTYTPSIIETTRPLERTIRKVKGRQSLRDIVERDESRDSVYSTASCNSNYDYSYSYNSYNHNHYHNHNHNYTSDCDTLVGSESPPSPLTPTSASFPRAKYTLSPLSINTKSSPYRQLSPSSESGEHTSNTGFQLSLDLLTEQLATGLFKKHPAEPLDRASGLQIRLMIEAYESVLLQLRGDDHIISKHLAAFEHTLNHWVRALYAVYDRTCEDASSCSESYRSCRSSFSSFDARLEATCDK